MGKSTIRKIGWTWSTFCGSCWKYGMGYSDFNVARHALGQHWEYWKAQEEAGNIRWKERHGGS
jgi:hypothetical protein